ncbi:hypothetical protein ALI144C_16875 [Actinosynnema sp. ALI-1.44]|uniref:BTAD domain-containing putative transcriptional regulator n=1 Tax=Actinosynnema sp. ALI-1.44 TaxID=1933779 RepID=UPI00097C6C49|nr:BTAD domain-containing putative transcriptional regulator [Actinosynnema sp. ALI-1.44]ONI83173.1 hypothetical protein ALI144C_16875 [Actinosynnema sp. ALI-1.44]
MVATQDDAFLGGPLRVEVLGPIRAWLGDTEIRLGPTRQRAVFATLAMRHHHVVTMDELIRAVWGDSAPTTAHGSVHTYMSGLRRVLEPNRSIRTASTVLPSVERGYRLNLAPKALDAFTFERLAGEARATLEHGSPVGALDIADRALSMWHGEPLAGLPGPFATTQRLRLTDVRFALLEARAEAGLATGRHAELVAELTTLVAQRPQHEGLRGLLMIALYRSGRQADALDHFHEARQALASVLGGRPGERLVEIHQQILRNDPALALASPRPHTQSVKALRPRQRAREFVGRQEELSRLGAALTELTGGRGGAVWVDGEPGIGKSELLTTGLADLDTAGVQVAWAAGDELAQQFPLRVMLRGLGIDAESGTVDNSPTTVDAMVALVRRLCDDRPLVLVVDDMQWVDDASMLVWAKLATLTSDLPLLLVAACRPLPQTPALQAMRNTVARENGTVLRLLPLSEGEVDQLLHGLLNAIPGPGLARLASRAAGNPLYVEELVDALVREEAVRVASGRADASTAPTMSLATAVEHRLDFLLPATVDVLRRATLLGTGFRIHELSTVLRRKPAELLTAIEEATTAGVLVADGERMAFRHPLIRQALYDGMIPALRGALHRHAAEALHHSGAPLDTVASHLAASASTMDPWTIAWVHEHGEQVGSRAPAIGLELLRRAVEDCGPADPRLDELTAGLARFRYRLNESPEDEVRHILATTRDPDLIGEMHWILTSVLFRRGMDAQAVSSLRAAVDTAGMSALWRARCLAMLAGMERPAMAETVTWKAVEESDRVGDAFAKGYARANLWLLRSISRDHVTALRFADEALTVVGEANDTDSTLSRLHVSLLDSRLFSLQNLDRLDEADDTLRTADELVRRHHLPAAQRVFAAVQHFWRGRWSEALPDFSVTAPGNSDVRFHGLRANNPTMLVLHGIASLIATYRGDQAQAGAHLAAADELPILTEADRENCEFLVIAEALAAERDGRLEAALIALKSFTDEHHSPMALRHQWLPDVVRIAVAAGKPGLAQRASDVCAVEARRETVPARAAAALVRCRGLIDRAPDELLAAARHYREVGRPVELAQTLEDAAVLLAAADRADEARAAHAEAIARYDTFGAVWLVHRATSRLKATGVTPQFQVDDEQPKAG